MTRNTITSIGVPIFLISFGGLAVSGHYLAAATLWFGWFFGFACGGEAEQMKQKERTGA
jgi:hypothetical protein